MKTSAGSVWKIMPSKDLHFGWRLFDCLKTSAFHFENFWATFHNLKFHLLTPTVTDCHPFDSPPREPPPWKPWAPRSSEVRLSTPRKGSLARGEGGSGKDSALPHGDQISVLTVNKLELPEFPGSWFHGVNQRSQVHSQTQASQNFDTCWFGVGCESCRTLTVDTGTKS